MVNFTMFSSMSKLIFFLPYIKMIIMVLINDHYSLTRTIYVRCMQIWLQYNDNTILFSFDNDWPKMTLKIIMHCLNIWSIQLQPLHQILVNRGYQIIPCRGHACTNLMHRYKDNGKLRSNEKLFIIFQFIE